MTDLYMAGTEIKGWRTLLADQEVEHVSLSYMGLRRRRKNPLDFRLADEYPAWQKIYLDSGCATLNKDPESTEEDAIELAQAYYKFVRANEDRIEFASMFDALTIGRDGIESLAQQDDLGGKLMPVWHSEWGTTYLSELAEKYDRVGVLQKEAKDTDLAPLLRKLAGQTKLHGVSMTSLDSMRELPWSTVATGSWLNVTQYGETFVWTGRELRWYPKRDKETARKRHRTWLADKGFDVEAIEADDNAELLRLSIWSWKQFAASIHSRGVTNMSVLDPFGNQEEQPAEVVTPGTPERNTELVLTRERKLLPVLGVSTHISKDADGNEVEERRLTTPSSGLLRCDNCFMREKCPEMMPGHDCAFEIPAQVRTAAQLEAVQNWTIETQTQRVAFMRLVEQAEGGYADANLSAEMDRLNRMIKTKQDAGKEGFSINIAQVSAAAQAPGFVRNILGNEVADKMSALPAPVDAKDVIAEAEIVEE